MFYKKIIKILFCSAALNVPHHIMQMQLSSLITCRSPPFVTRIAYNSAVSSHSSPPSISHHMHHHSSAVSSHSSPPSISHHIYHPSSSQHPHYAIHSSSLRELRKWNCYQGVGTFPFVSSDSCDVFPHAPRAGLMHYNLHYWGKRGNITKFARLIKPPVLGFILYQHASLLCSCISTHRCCVVVSARIAAV